MQFNNWFNDKNEGYYTLNTENYNYFKINENPLVCNMKYELFTKVDTVDSKSLGKWNTRTQ